MRNSQPGSRTPRTAIQRTSKSACTAWSRARAPLDNACVLEYEITNNGAQPTDPLAAGVFCDFKMTGWNMNDSFDVASAESSRQMAYVYTGDTACLAVKLLYPVEAMKGISVIDGYNYIQHSGQMSNAVKDSFLWGRKVVMAGATPKNWAAMVSAGPFVIPRAGSSASPSPSSAVRVGPTSAPMPTASSNGISTPLASPKSTIHTSHFSLLNSLFPPRSSPARSLSAMPCRLTATCALTPSTPRAD